MTNCEIHFRGKAIAKAEAQIWELDGATGIMLRGPATDRDGLEDAYLDPNETVILLHNENSMPMIVAQLYFPDNQNFEAFLIAPHVTFDHEYNVTPPSIRST